jgi:hypothetical protein
MKATKFLLALALAFGVVTGAIAGSQADSEPNFEPQKIAAFAKQVERELAAKGARVFIIARVGRPQGDLPSGIKYTHTAFGVYSTIKTRDGRTLPGYAIYNLYQRAGEPAVSDLVTDYPVDFFMGVHDLRAGIIIPKPELQRRLLNVIGSHTYKSLHNPKYSVIANPFDTTFQNCTEHTLDVINAAIYQTDDRKQLKANSKAHFEAQKINMSPIKLMLGSLLTPGVSLGDHEGIVQTSTFTTIARYLERNGLVNEQFVITSN